LQVHRRVGSQPGVDRAADVVGQYLAGACCQPFERGANDGLGRALRRVDVARQVRVDEPRVQGQDVRLLLLELDAQGVRQGPGGRLAGAVDGEGGAADPTRDRQQVEYGAAAVFRQ